MGLLDLFTGAASQKAAKNNLSAIAAGHQQAGAALQDSARASLGYLFGNGATPGAMQVTDRGYDQAVSDLGSQYGATQQILGKLGELYQPLTEKGGAAYDRYLDATGANGADGSARATTAFQAAPGYAYSLDSALGAVQRSAAAEAGRKAVAKAMDLIAGAVAFKVGGLPAVAGAYGAKVGERAVVGGLGAMAARRSFEGGAPRLLAPPPLLPLGQIATGEGLALGQR